MADSQPETVKWLETHLKPESVFYDIGASIGAWSLIAASIISAKGTVYAFEPQAVSYASLAVNVVINAKNDRVITLPILLDHTDKILHLAMPDQSWLFSGAVVPSPRGSPEEVSHSVIVARLDALRDRYALKRPTLIKVDVDGNELHCLEGMRQTMKDDGLASMMVEMRENAPDRDKVEAMLKGAGLAFESQHDSPHKDVFNYIWSRPEREEQQVA